MLVPALVMLMLLGSITYYFARRSAQCLQYVFPRFPFAVSLLIFVLLTAVLAVGFMRSMLPLSAAVKGFLRIASAYWMGVFVYLLLYLLITDAAVLLGRLFRLIPKTMAPAARFASVLTALALTLATSVYGFCHAANIRHASYDAAIPKLQEDMTIALVSDLHLGAVGSEERLEKVVREVNSLHADVICIAGDLFDNDFAAIRDPERAAALLGELNAPYGVYACFGNHDAGKTIDEMKALVEKSGVKLLSEGYVQLDGRLILAGRADGTPIGGNGGERRRPVSEVLSGADTSLPVVVMDHNPANIGDYGAETALVLSGHTHRGQIFPGSLITGRMYAVDYGHGQPDENGPQLIVTSGAGTWGMPMRVGTDCEVVLVRLHP